MMRVHFPFSLCVSLLLFLTLLCPSAPLEAYQVNSEITDLDTYTYALPETWVTVQNEELEVSPTLVDAETYRVLQDFDRRERVTWIKQFDRITGKINHMEGDGIPWIPGTANGLTGKVFGLSAVVEGKDIPVDLVAERALETIRTHRKLFGVEVEDLQLMPEASGPMLDYLYYIDFQWNYFGIPVEGAHIVFRLNHGNVVQIGMEKISASIEKLDPVPYLTKEWAWEVLADYIGGMSQNDTIIEPGHLLILPLSTSEVMESKLVKPGTGLVYRMVYVLSFRREGITGTWEALIDAQNGEIISFKDSNRYGSVHGGAYPGDRPVPETDRLFPYMDIGGGNYADESGQFTGTSATGTMNGDLVRVVSGCGAISLTTSTGDLNFGSSSGTDCTTPGFGGVGNTHAARTQYYNVTLIKMKALTYMPANSWLNGQIRVNTDGAAECNAYWDGSTTNFFRSVSGCANLGELPGVSLHEWAHGLDSNDGSVSSDRGTGETYGDFTGSLQTHASCAGNGALSSNCSGYGDACLSCTGVRDIDYDKHASHSPTFPEDLTSNTCSGCTTFACSSSATYAGPCGREGHCESLVSSQAMWDLATRDLVTWGLDATTAWQTMDRYWYASRSTSGSAYACPSVTTANGCGTSNYFTTFRVVDDCDGNLANGTPHASAIYNAFNRHKIACTTVVNTDQTNCCPTISAPVISGVAGNNQVTLSWNDVTNAAKYYVYRNENSCTSGFTKIGTVTDDGSASFAFIDNSVVNGVTFYYRVQAIGTSDSCQSPMSNCITIVPVPCTTPGTPTNLTATVPGLNQIRLAWSAGSPAGATYTLYRSYGACPGTTFTMIASGVSGSPYTDNTVSGGTTYSYKVSAVDSTGGCESLQSGCDDALATGTCTREPTFAGLVSVTNAGYAVCSLILDWDAATSNCSGSITYNLYRSTTTPFTPGISNRIATGLTGTAYTDDVDLVYDTTYYYVVRAVDTANSAEDTNTVIQSATVTGPFSNGTWFDDLEPSQDAGWTHAAASGTDDWALSTTQSHSATHSWASVDVASITDKWVIAPQKGIGTAAILTFWHRYAFESGFDGGVIEISTDNGVNWDDLGSYITAGGYSGTLSTTYGNPLGGRSAWTGTISAFAQATVNLASFSGENALIRWRMGCDQSVASGTWYIDDIQITNVQTSSSCTTGSGCTAPAAPTGLSASGTCSGVDLSWNSVSGATGYIVYRSSSTSCPGSGYSSITSGVTGTSYSDVSATAGTTYTYVVTAYTDSEACESVDSSCVAGTRLSTPAIPGSPTYANVSCTTLTVNWSTASGATLYDLYRNTGSCGVGSLRQANISGTTFNDTGLSASTTYGYSVVAKNASNCSSAAGTCTTIATTAATPAAPGAPTYTNVSCSSLTVNWTAVTNATAYDVYRSLGGSCASASLVASDVTGTSFNDSGLSASTPYSYYVIAKNTCGSSAAGTCSAITTTAAPGAPGTPTYTNVSCTTLTVNWTSATGATVYDVYRSSDLTCSSPGPTPVAANVSGTSFADSGLSQSSPYSYYVVAKNACGSTAGACSSVGTTGVPAIPTGLSVDSGCTGNSMTWDAVTGATSYNIMRGATCGGVSQIATSATESYNDTSATAGVTYNYAIQAVNSCGSSGNSSCQTGTRLFTPAVPTGLSASGTCSAVDVSWNSVSGADSYAIYRGSSCGDVVQIGTSGSTTYSDTTATAGTLYYYAVQAINSAGPCESALTACQTGTRLAIPAIPTGISATGDCDGINVSWNSVSGATTYTVLRGSSCGAVASLATNISSTSYSDTTATAGATYYYAVQAVNSCGSSSVSTCASSARIVTPGAPSGLVASIPGNNQIELNWSAGSPAGSEYHIYRSTGACPGSTFTMIAQNVVTTTYTDSTVVGGQTYSYLVRASDSTDACESPASNCDNETATAPSCPDPPTFDGLVLVSGTEDSDCTLDLTWRAGSSNCSGTISYNIYRSETPSFTPDATTLVATGVSGTTYSDVDTLTGGTTYYYIVRAIDSINGISDGNTLEKSGDPSVVSIFFDDFEEGTGLGTWTTGYFAYDALGWQGMQNCTPTTSGDFIFRFGGTGCTDTYPINKNGFAQPGIPDGDSGLTIPSNLSNVRLSFWHRWAFEDRYDGALFRVSFDGNTYYYISAAATGVWLSGGYTGLVYYPLGQTSTTRNAWTASQSTMIHTVIDVDAMIAYVESLAPGVTGPTMWFSFGTVSDPSVMDTGWFYDDVHIYGTTDVTCDCAFPYTPQNVSATAGTNLITVNWQAAAGMPLDGTFDLYRATGACPASGAARIATGLTSTTFVDSPLANGSTYAYYVVAVSGTASCESVASACDSDTVVACEIPESPTNVAATIDSSINVTVSWSAALRADSYNILRYDGACPSGGSPATISGVSSPFIDTTAESGSSYCYIVQAVNACGTTDATEETGTRLSPPGVPDGSSGSTAMTGAKVSTDGSTITVTWDNSCSSNNYELLWGYGADLPLSTSGTYSPSGSVCGSTVGNGTSHEWSSTPDSSSDLVWWIIVATDSVDTEGSWGSNSSQERTGAGTNGSSGLCSISDKNTSNTCGQ